MSFALWQIRDNSSVGSICILSTNRMDSGSCSSFFLFTSFSGISVGDDGLTMVTIYTPPTFLMDLDDDSNDLLIVAISF
jgi:hypothetical protein